MNLMNQYSLGPEFTPKVISRLIWTTVIVSLLCAILQLPFMTLLNMDGPEAYLSLSRYGLNQFYFWQPLTFLFVQSGGEMGISFSYLMALTFNMYLIWILGSSLCDFFTTKGFLIFYFFCGLCAGALALTVLSLTGHYGAVSGPTPCLLAILLVWTMLNPETQIFLFFLIPIKVKWLTLGILGAMFLISLSHLDWIGLSYDLGGALAGYFYALFIWELRSPFPETHSFDQQIHEWSRHYRSKFEKIKSKIKKPDEKESEKKRKKKIVDIYTGNEKQNDDAFIDEMLVKIAKHGEKSLTWYEKQRMQSISEKKRK